MKYFFSLFFLIFSSVFVSAQTVKRLYIANDDHTDYMWTANEATYDSAFVHMLDYYLAQIDSTKNSPADFQARFNCDGSYWLRAYEKYRSPTQFNRLMNAIKSGHISSPLNTVVSTFGAQPTEAILRGMYYAGELERKHKLRFSLAGAMENNTLPLGISSLWAGSGAKYSWKGIGGYGSQMTYESRESRRHPIYNFKGPDSSGVLVKWYNFTERTLKVPFGGYAECRLVIKSTDRPRDMRLLIGHLDHLCDTLSVTSKYPYNVAGAFGYGHDDLDNYTSPLFINAAKSETTPNRKVRVSNEEDFFRDIVKSYPKLPSESVSYGNEWDLYCASMNETTARVRRSTEKLRSAEAIASLVVLKNPKLFALLDRTKKQAWESFGMYWEHNWTADGPVKQSVRAAWQNKIQSQITGYTDSLFNQAVLALGSQIRKTLNRRFYVFNPLSWARDDVADFEFNDSGDMAVFDVSTGKEVASQRISKSGRQFIRIKAEQVPSVGYKVYELRQAVPVKRPVAATLDGEYVSNSRYRIRFSPSGAITEMYDLAANNRQLVQASDGRFVNDLGSTNELDRNPVVVESSGPVSVTLKAISNNPVPHTVRLTLFADMPRIEIEDSIQANFKDVKTWAFSFGLKDPTTRHEELGAILTAKKETRGGHYSSQNARLDWQTFNHFADMSESNYGVTISNQDCSFFKLGKGTVDSLWESSSQLSALAGGRVDTKREDKGILGIANQNGEQGFFYKFALTNHQNEFDAVAAMKFSLEHQNPFVTGLVTGNSAIYPGKVFSLLSLTDPGVLLWSLKPSEDGIKNDLTTRFWNMNETPSRPIVKFSSPVRQAWHTTHIETIEKKIEILNGSLKLDFRPNQIKTYKLTL